MSRLYELYNACGGKVITDSRAAKCGEMYFALKGEKFDGNCFALSALENGARYAVVDAEGIDDDRIIKVDDCLEALQNLASEHRQTLDIEIFALTGTNGKTTTKELTKVALETKYDRVGCTAGNFNNHIGVPLTLLSFNELTEIGVIEMGANHPGEIAELCKIAMPNVGLITNIGLAHLEGFGSFEGVKSTKAELFDYLTISGGKAIYNTDDKVVAELISSRNIKAVGYSTNTLKDIDLKLFGDYNKKNAAAAVCVAQFFGADIAEAINAVKHYVPHNNRSEIIASTSRSNRLVIDCYNANPSSMTAAVSEFIATEGKDAVMILGAMKELGEFSHDEHQKLYKLSQNAHNICYYIGLEFSGIVPKEFYFLDVEEASKMLEISGKSVLLKGSRSVGLEKLISIL